jgi:Zn-dependent M28 family amino/carboxypeptidase
MKNSYYLILMLATIAWACKQEPSVSYRNIEKDLTALSSDKYKGRAPMDDSEEGVVSYIAKEMQEAGLEPANGNSWYQEVPVMAVTSRISPTLDIETSKGKLQFKKLTEYVSFSRKVEENINLDRSELIFAGFGITAPEYGRDDFAGIDVKGKTILVFVNDPGYSTTGDYFKGNTMTYYGRWTYKFEEAARKGAAGCFIIHEAGPAGYPWAVVENNGDGTSLYLKPTDGYHDRCSVEGWITQESASRLFEACGLTFEEAKKEALKKNFKPFSLKARVTASMKNSFTYGISRNVCGLIRGTERADEAVVYTAHWDHLGVGRPVGGDSIYNGASDNASAVAWMLEIARVMKKTPPKRSVLFLSVTCEESGLLGSGYYTEHPFFPMNKTVACLNTDGFMFLGKFRDVTVTGYGESELDEILKKEAARQGRYIVADPNPEQGMFFRSDQLPFMKKGVPALFAKGFVEAERYGKSGTRDRTDRFLRETYHKPSDEYHPESGDDLSGVVQDAELFLNIGLQLANSKEWPKWKEGAEFNR